MAKIRTVRGDIAPEDNGITLTHEHILYANPGADLDHHAVFDVDAVAQETAGTLIAAARDYGYQTMVDLTPCELGRHPVLMRKAAELSGVNIIATTGFFPEKYGIPYHWRVQPIDYIKDFLVRDITEGMVHSFQPTGVKAGIIKIATGSAEPGEPTPIGPHGRRIGRYEDRVIRAAGRAQRETGVCINTHTEPRDYAVTNPGIEQLEILEEEGADLSKVLIGHALVDPDVDQLKEICARGANLQVDHVGIPWQHESEGADAFDERMADAICRVVDLGFLDRLTFTYDRFFHHCRGPITEEAPELLNERVDFAYMFESFLPRLAKRGWAQAEFDQVLIHNPRRLLAF